MNPVKVGESPGCLASEPTPSQARWFPSGRCRDQTARTYGLFGLWWRRAPAHEPCSAWAAKAEVGRKSLAARRAGSIPASGTITFTRLLFPQNARTSAGGTLVHIGSVNIRISIHSQFIPCASGATKPSTWVHARALWLCRWGTRPPFSVLPLDIPNGTSRGRQEDGGDELTASASTASDPSWDRHSGHPWGAEPAGLPWQGLHAPCLPWPC